MNNYYGYFIFGGAGIITVLTISMGIEKMIKIIIGNYILAIFLLFFGDSINLFVNYLYTANFSFVKDMNKIIDIIIKSKTMIVISVYLILLILISLKSKLSVGEVSNKYLRGFLMIFLAPFTVISTIFALSAGVVGSKVFDYNQILVFIDSFRSNFIVYKTLTFLPIWFILPGILIIIISLRFNLNFKMGSFKKKQLEEDDDE